MIICEWYIYMEGQFEPDVNVVVDCLELVEVDPVIEVNLELIIFSSTINSRWRVLGCGVILDRIV